jgi:hypothetical protein
MNGSSATANGFHWKICRRLKAEHRTGTSADRRWRVFQYRKAYPKASELRVLAKRHPRHEFRVFGIGQGC